ncbi:MAG: neutral/alkaline non-lysosomal ceramidase N-terminal domain-containing protein [Clostridia bacterium]|nr:neutral/alkaline non-lysosomal ceramidase N-terminal domain-containing protein [Clostridia bacterium]
MTEKLRLGVSEKIITPRVGCNLCGYAPDVISESVNDDLTATAYYFSCGATEALIISNTLCIISTELADRLRREIETETKIPFTNIIVHATHTHSGPITTDLDGWGDADTEYIEKTLVPAVKCAASEAKANAEAVKMGISVGESLVGINRRERLEDNTVKLGQNPWGPYDPKMTVISFKTESGEIKASMVHYGCHGTAAGRNHEISRDWSGFMVDAVSEHGGGICAFFNGPEGDVGPRLMNGKTIGFDEKNGKSGNIKCAEELGHYAACDAVKIFKATHAYHDAGLEVSRTFIKIPIEARPTLEFAKEEYEKYKEFTVNWQGGKAAHYRNIIKSYEDGYVDKEYREVEQIIVKIGELAFVSFAFELFSEIGLRIQKDSTIPYTLSLSNANGTDSYFATENELCRGGYEVTMFKQRNLQPYADNGDAAVIKETLSHLRSLKGE